MKSLLINLVFIFAFQGSAFSSSKFDEGLAAANKENYYLAINSFEEIIKKEPANVSAFHNLGNCYHKMNQYGKAILNYERALKLKPNDEELIQNIEASYRKTGEEKVWISPYSTFDTILYRIGPLIWTIFSIVAAITCGITLYVILKGKAQVLPILLLFITFLIFFIIAAKRSDQYMKEQDFGIVTSKSAMILLNELGELSGAELKEGTRVSIVRQLKSHYEVLVSNGKKVYLMKESIDLF